MENNELKSIPKEIGELSNLKILNLTDNYLTELPEEIGELISLEKLLMYSNQLKKLPGSIANLATTLTFLGLPKTIDEENLNDLKRILPNTEIIVH